MTGFAPLPAGPSWAETRPARRVAEDPILEELGGISPKAVLEFGPGTGDFAALLLLRHRSADYLGLEPSPALLAVSRATLTPFSERAGVEARDLALPLPLEGGSADLALCLDLLEYLRMDELYMTISEARRALTPGSLFALRCLSFGSGWRGKWAAAMHAWFPKRFGGARPLELTHYFSPEDWRVVSDRRVPEGWLTRQTVVLARLPEPVATK